ncbi:MAG: hypothetical protein KDB02_12235, partial [Acidimicrobiales bacterium]|nr:hypothetical protein [Acidimicrobiales bacterium]
MQRKHLPLSLGLLSCLTLSVACSDDGGGSNDEIGTSDTDTADTTDSTSETGTTDTTTTDTTDTTTVDDTTDTTDTTTTVDDTTDTTDTTTGELCGNGVIDDGEQCDDGDLNADDAACTSACQTAVCGDGLVQTDVEACDDGNADETDACTTLCAAPACDDGILSGAETDVDCGGGCGGCDFGLACSDAADCLSGNCLDNLCSYAASCKDLKDADANAEDGLYMIDIDGGGDLE